MSDYEIKVGSTSQRIGVTLADSSSTVGAGLAGLAFGSAGLTCYYWRESDGNVATTAVTLATATKGTFTSSGFIEKDATNMPGHYEVGVPDAAIAAGSKWVRVMFKGATNLAQRTVVIRLLAVDPDNATSMGISRLDVAVSQGPAILVGTAQAGAAGTITLAAGVSSADSNLIGAVVYITSGTGVGQAGRVITAYVQATKVASVSPNWQTTPDNTSVYAVVPTPPAPTASTALPSVNTTQFAGQTVTAAAGVTLPASVASPTNITAASGVTLSSAGVQAVWDALTSALTTVGSVGKRIADFLTGDAYVRLGAPAGASTAADIAALPTNATVKTQVVAALITDTYAEPAAVPAATSSIKDKIGYLFTSKRNKVTQTATTQLLRNDTDSATIGTSTVSDDSTVFIKGKDL